MTLLISGSFSFPKIFKNLTKDIIFTNTHKFNHGKKRQIAISQRSNEPTAKRGRKDEATERTVNSGCKISSDSYILSVNFPIYSHEKGN